MPAYNKTFHQYAPTAHDALIHAYFPELSGDLIRLGVATLSTSVQEEKGDARALGYRNVKGRARSIATYAGSLILPFIDGHPMVGVIRLYEQWLRANGKPLGWSLDQHLNGVGTALDQYDYTNMLCTRLPPLNLKVQYVAEGANWSPGGSGTIVEGASKMLVGVEFINMNVVDSVMNTGMELVTTFKACDYKPYAMQSLGGESPDQSLVASSSDAMAAHRQLRNVLFGG